MKYRIKTSSCKYYKYGGGCNHPKNDIVCPYYFKDECKMSEFPDLYSEPKTFGKKKIKKKEK